MCPSFLVSDTGIGIPKNMQAKVFGPFVQVGGAARKFQGTGLGLHIVKQLVILMGGEVHMESEEGKGTTVSFSALLPCEEKDTDQCHAPESELVTEIGPKKILIVEDERVNQIAISKLVERLGHSTTSVANGQEALNALARKNFDLILMDIQMPVMNGIETTQQIRALKDEKHRAIPIVALTAHAMSGDRDKFLEVGMNDYLAKPVSMDTLAVVLARVLGA